MSGSQLHTSLGVHYPPGGPLGTFLSYSLVCATSNSGRGMCRGFRGVAVSVQESCVYHPELLGLTRTTRSLACTPSNFNGRCQLPTRHRALTVAAYMRAPLGGSPSLTRPLLLCSCRQFSAPSAQALWVWGARVWRYPPFWGAQGAASLEVRIQIRCSKYLTFSVLHIIKA